MRRLENARVARLADPIHVALTLAAFVALTSSTTVAAEQGELFTDPGFESLAIKQGKLAPPSQGNNRWRVAGIGAEVTQLNVAAAAAHSGKQGLELRRAGRAPRVGVQQVVALPAGLYEITVWARGAGSLLLAADNHTRRLDLTDPWQPYSLVFAIDEPRDVAVELATTDRVQLDDASLRAADDQLKAAWEHQERVRLQFGFVPAAASAQRPPPDEEIRAWALPTERLRWKSKAVYHDPRYDEIHIYDSKRLADYLAGPGEFERLDAPALGRWLQQWLNAGPYGTVVVLTMGAAPSSAIAPGEGADALIMQYLRAGGRVVWLGEWPFSYCQGERSPSLGAPQGGPGLLDIRWGWGDPIWGFRGGSAEITELGKRWGLTRANGPVLAAYVEDVTAPLASFYNDDAQSEAAVCWFKNLSPEHPWGGVIAAHRSARYEQSPQLCQDAYRLALYAGEPVEAPPMPKPEEAPGASWELTITLDEPDNRSCYLRGETIPVTLVAKKQLDEAAAVVQLDLSLHELGATASGKEGGARIPAPARKTGARGEAEAGTTEASWSIPTENLACGHYRLTGRALDAQGQPLAALEHTVSVCPARPETGFYYGAWCGTPKNPYRMQMLMEQFAEMAMNPSIGSPGANPEALDQCLKYGFRYRLRNHGHARGPFEEGSLRVTPEGEHVPSAWGGGRPMRSLASEVYRRQMAESFAEELVKVGSYPAAFPFAHTNDDYSVRYGLDYCKVARDKFREKTGLEAPAPEAIRKQGVRLGMTTIDRPSGIVPDDDPWLQWYTFTTRDVCGGFNRALTRALREKLPGVRVGSVPGGMQLPLWLPGMYPPHHFGPQGFDALSYYYYLNYWQPSIGAVYWDNVARMANRDLPLYVTPGVRSADEPTYYRNMFYLHLAGGAQGLDYFCFRDIELRDRARAELARLGREVVRPYGPLLGKLRPSRAKLGLLLPYTHAIHENFYPTAAVYAYGNLLQAHLDVEPTCEEELISGNADRYEGILLWRVKWLRRSAYDALLRYIEQGGRVYADVGTQLDIPGAIRLPVDLALGNVGVAEVRSPTIRDYAHLDRVAAVRNALEEHLALEIDSPQPHLLVRRAQAMGVNYLWLVQLHTKEDYAYLRERIGAGVRPADPEKAKQEAVAYLDAKAGQGPFEATVALPAGCVPYDVFHGRAIEAKPSGDRLIVNVPLECLGGALIALYPKEIARIELRAPKIIDRGNEGRIELTVLAADGKPAIGTQPVRIEVLTPAGPTEQWNGTYATASGRITLPIRPANNHPTGRWRVRAAELSSGREAETTFDVR